MKKEEWYARYLGKAFHVASWSKDPSSKHGCYLTTPSFRPISFGYNGMPEGRDDSILHSDDKYEEVIHAEGNAICNAARVGSCTEGAIAFITGRPCLPCLGHLRNCGVKLVVFHPLWDELCKDRWLKQYEKYTDFLRQTKLKIEIFGFVDRPEKAYFRGHEYELEVYGGVL